MARIHTDQDIFYNQFDGKFIYLYFPIKAKRIDRLNVASYFTL